MMNPCVADGDDRLLRMLLSQPCERPAHPGVESVPAVPTRCERPIGFGLHVERTVLDVVLGPGETVGIAGVDLAEIHIVTVDVEAHGRSEDLGRLDRPRQHARQEHIGLHPSSLRPVIAQCCRLQATRLGETCAAADPTDHAVEAGVRLTVTDQDQSHGDSP